MVLVTTSWGSTLKAGTNTYNLPLQGERKNRYTVYIYISFFGLVATKGRVGEDTCREVCGQFHRWWNIYAVSPIRMEELVPVRLTIVDKEQQWSGSERGECIGGGEGKSWLFGAPVFFRVLEVRGDAAQSRNNEHNRSRNSSTSSTTTSSCCGDYNSSSWRMSEVLR